MTLDITYSETDERMVFPPGGGGRPVAVIANDTTLTVGQVYTFRTPAEAIAACHAGSDMLNAIIGKTDGTQKGIFNEGGQYEMTDSLGVDTVYAIPIPATPTADDYNDAITLPETLPPKQATVEAFIGLSTPTILSAIATHLSNLEAGGDPRTAVATVSSQVIADMQTEISTLTTSRIAVHTDPTIVGVLAAHIACTPYQDDPAKQKYRSNPTIQTWTGTDLHTLRDSGLCADYEGSNGPQPYMVVSPAYKEVGGTRSIAGLFHSRLNMDQHIIQIYNILERFKYDNNYQDSRNSIEQNIESYLSKELEKPTIEDYTINVALDHSSPFKVDVTGSIRVMGAIYEIAISENMQTPTGNVETQGGA